MESETPQSEKSTKLPLDEAEPLKPFLMRQPRNAAEYNAGYADGMREGVAIVAVAMLLAIFLLVRFMGEAA